MENLLSFIVKNLTGTDNFKIERVDNDGFTLFTLLIPADLVGLVIGKEGKCIKAIRTLLKVRATLENIRADVNIEPL